MVLFNNAPHPNAAKVFINWILSKDAQSDWSKRAVSNSRRLDAERGDPNNVLDAESWMKGLNFNSEALVPVREQALEMAQSALQ